MNPTLKAIIRGAVSVVAAVPIVPAIGALRLFGWSNTIGRFPSNSARHDGYGERQVRGMRVLST